MFRKILCIAIAMLVPITSLQANEDSDQLAKILIIAKAHGMCGVFYQITNFQKTTQLEGGDEFIVRFINTELARLDIPLDEFVENCKKISETYTTLQDGLKNQ